MLQKGTGAVSPLVLIYEYYLDIMMMNFLFASFSFVEMCYNVNKSTPVVAHYQCRQGRDLSTDIIHYWFLLNKLQIVIWV